MMSNPKRTLLAGLVLGALVIGASVMRSDEDKIPAAQSGSDRDGTSMSGELDNGSGELQRSNPASASNHSDDISHILQAIRDSLKRNDLASAKVLLGAVQTLHKDDSRALTLQKELQAREEKVDTVPQVAPPDNPQNTAKPAQSRTRFPARTEHSHESAFSVREHTISTSRRLRIMGDPRIKAASNGGVHAEAASPALGIGRTDSSLPGGVPAVAPTVASTPPRPALIRPTPPMEEALPPVQPLPPKPLPVQSDQAPKTRAQVRAELDRARTDGSLPRFGNPDPAGPGGLPSSTKTEIDRW
ncbi:hypothetical protein SBC1_36890 (plasmid) [Caballeronia sp. SBC1]|nr:hypothetical protein SBC2_51050 [Caballeronia sp. SBC2]QIN63649.1 hypothetical protein SBC1_36890 [Caballeronia sp. SBC1]